MNLIRMSSPLWSFFQLVLVGGASRLPRHSASVGGSSAVPVQSWGRGWVWWTGPAQDSNWQRSWRKGEGQEQGGENVEESGGWTKSSWGTKTASFGWSKTSVFTAWMYLVYVNEKYSHTFTDTENCSVLHWAFLKSWWIFYLFFFKHWRHFRPSVDQKLKSLRWVKSTLNHLVHQPVVELI